MVYREQSEEQCQQNEIIIIGNNGTKGEPPIHIEVKEEGKLKFLKPKRTIKILGVHIDDQLTWDIQIQYVRKKATNSIRNLHRVNP